MPFEHRGVPLLFSNKGFFYRNYIVQDIDQLEGGAVVMSKPELFWANEWGGEGVKFGE